MAIMGATMHRYVCYLPPVVRTMAKWQCVATRVQGCAEALLALATTMGGLPQVAGYGEPQWDPKGMPMQC